MQDLDYLGRDLSNVCNLQTHDLDDLDRNQPNVCNLQTQDLHDLDHDLYDVRNVDKDSPSPHPHLLSVPAVSTCRPSGVKHKEFTGPACARANLEALLACGLDRAVGGRGCVGVFLITR